MNPWHWLLISQEGDVRPCSHGAVSVGNLGRQSIGEIWNGPIMQELRASILEDKVHSVCKSRDCPFQQSQAAFREPTTPVFPGRELAVGFDEDYYLQRHKDLA